MRVFLSALLLSGPLLLGACGDGGEQSPPGEDFHRDTDVWITWPANGETVEPAFTLTYEAGADVSELWVEVDGNALTKPQAAREQGAIALELDEGRHRLALVGANAGGGELSRYAITVRVAEPSSSWVSITSPPDGAVVPNPVTFAVSASSDVEQVELLADGWSLGTVEPGGVLSYTFTGTGYERRIEADGYAGGSLVAADSITITVDPGSSPPPSDWNDWVVSMLETYPTDGTHQYYWPSSGDWAGVTRDIWYLDTLVAEGDPQGRCYCVGITWEVYMRTFDEVDRATGGDGTLNGLDVDELYDFRADWYVRDLWGAGVLDALENYGLGERVTDLEDLRPGDFVQFWRNSGSGHSVIFIDWERDAGGDITGIEYWSCQSGTDGIGYQSESFGSGSGDIDPAYFFAARGWMPEDWEWWGY